jgi:HK97 gp10 family phage protein
VKAIEVHIAGLEDQLRKVDLLKKGLRTRLLRRSLGRAAKPILERARELVPEETGLTRRALGVKVKAYPSGVIAAIIGPRTGYRQLVYWSPSEHKYVLQGSGVGRERDPATIAHLAEFGSVHEKARPFMRPALDEKGGDSAAILRDEVDEALRELAP